MLIKGYDLWHRAWLQFAQFNEQRAIKQLDVWWTWQAKQLRKYCLHNKATDSMLQNTNEKITVVNDIVNKYRDNR